MSSTAQAPTQDAYSDIAEKYAPGETYGTSASSIRKGSYGKKNQLIDDKYKDAWRALVTKIQHRDMFARIEEVKRAADGGFYWRNIFDAFWSDLQFTWMQGAGSAGLGNDSNGNSETLSYPLNIYQAFGRAYMKIVGHQPEVHIVASGDSATALQMADGANHLLEEIQAINQDANLPQEFAVQSYTGGRYGIYTRWVADGSRFGYYDEDEDDEGMAEGVGQGSENPPKKKPRQPRGGEVQSLYGVPWLKVPINMKHIHEFAWLMLSDEIDLSAAKSLYPWIAKRIQAGEPGPAEFMFDRTTRIALTQGLHLVSQMAEALDQLPTIQTIWVRPCMFAEIDDEECREWFEDNYPDGGCVVFLGNEYAESRNESMDDHWSIGHAVKGHGQATPAYGASMLVAQDAFSDVFDLEMETHMRAIPAIHFDPDTFDLSARSKQKANPGAAYPLKHGLESNINVGQKAFAEPAVSVSAQLLQTRTDLATTLSTVVTGISPAAVGQADENNTTLGGISILRAASRGEAGTAFEGFIRCYSKSCEQAIRIGAKYRLAEADADGVLTIKKKGHPDVLVNLIDLRDGNIWCVPDTDQTYPSTFEEEQLALTQLTMAAQTGDESAKAALNDPGNQERISQLRGISGMKSSVGDIGMKVSQTIDMLLVQPPVPNEQAVQAAQMVILQAVASGQQPPTPEESDKYKLFKSSMEPGPLDDVTKELPFITAWIYSPTGQRNRFNNPDGFLNVELYGLSLQAKIQQQMEQAQAAAVKPQLAIEAAKKQPTAKAPPHPSESINYKDAGHAVQMQMEAQAGLDGTADHAAALTEEQLNPPQPPTPAAPRKLKRK